MVPKTQKLALIRSGREAIEHAMLDTALLSFMSAESDKHDLDALSKLLENYNLLMAKQQRILSTVRANNDEVNKQEK